MARDKSGPAASTSCCVSAMMYAAQVSGSELSRSVTFVVLLTCNVDVVNELLHMLIRVEVLRLRLRRLARDAADRLRQIALAIDALNSRESLIVGQRAVDD